MSVDEALAHLRFLCGATDLPVNADFEAGFADTPEGVAANVARCVETGVAGLSIEDRDGQEFFPFEAAVARLRAARAAIDASGADVVLVGRCEAYLMPSLDMGEVLSPPPRLRRGGRRLPLRAGPARPRRRGPCGPLGRAARQRQPDRDGPVGRRHGGRRRAPGQAAGPVDQRGMTIVEAVAVRPAAQARPEPCRDRRGRRGVKGDVLAPRRAGRAGRPAEDAGRADRVDEAAVGRGVAAGDGGPAPVIERLGGRGCEGGCHGGDPGCVTLLHPRSTGICPPGARLLRVRRRSSMTVEPWQSRRCRSPRARRDVPDRSAPSRRGVWGSSRAPDLLSQAEPVRPPRPR